MAGLSIALPVLVGLFDPFPLVIAVLMLISAWLVPVPGWPKAFLVATQRAGWRLLGWMGGLLVVAMGAAFIIFDAVGDLPVWAGAVTVLGGLATIALVERARAAAV